jgi:hypothetical protein
MTDQISKRQDTLNKLAFQEGLAFDLSDADPYSKMFWMTRMGRGRHVNFDIHLTDQMQISTAVSKLVSEGWDHRES